jgi:hypothetical protein
LQQAGRFTDYATEGPSGCWLARGAPQVRRQARGHLMPRQTY